MSTVEEVIAKVQKLCRLATSTNVHEAAAAAAAADRLIQEHDLAEAQLQSEGVTGAEAPTDAGVIAKDADTALKINPTLPRAYFVRASLKLHDLEIANAEAEIAKSDIPEKSFFYIPSLSARTTASCAGAPNTKAGKGGEPER